MSAASHGRRGGVWVGVCAHLCACVCESFWFVCALIEASVPLCIVLSRNVLGIQFPYKVCSSKFNTQRGGHGVRLPRWLSGKESACNAGVAGDSGSIPGSERSPGGGHGNSLQYSCLEDPLDRRACWAIVHGVTKSRT